MTLALADLNRMDPAGFAAAVGDVFELAPWVAKAAHARQPFATVSDLHAAMMGAVRAAPREQQVAFVRNHPDLVTTEFYKAKRGNRLYFDTGRNALGSTFVAAYSLRGKSGAPVSTPIEWSELDDKKLRSDGFTLKNVRQRLAKKGDPWRDLRKYAGSVNKALRALTKL